MNKIDNTISRLDTLIDDIDNNHFDFTPLLDNSNLTSLEEIINYYLVKIKEIDNDIDVNVADELLKSFDYNYGVSDGDSRIINYSIMEEANIICDDLIKKIKCSNNRTITLPINLKTLIEYAISSYISPNNINKVIYYIIIKLAIIYSSYK